MDCSEFRERIGSDPASLDAGSAAHERSCAACAAYARRLRNAEPLIAAALRFDVARIRAPRTAEPRTRYGRSWMLAAAVAVVAVGLWLGRTFVPSGDPVRLAEAVEQHWYHEPESWQRTGTPIGNAVLEATVGNVAEIDLSELGVVSYARSCLVNGRWVPHLVIQGRAGPIMVLLLARESVSAPQPLDLPSEHLRGVITPFGEGSIAILGDDDEPLEAVTQELADAIAWTI